MKPLLLLLVCLAAVAVASDTNSSASVDFGFDAADFLPLVWSAPFLSGGGYCSEALSFASSLAPFLGSRLSLLQHGDAVNMAFIRGLDPNMRSLLQSSLKQPHQVERSPPVGVSICHSEPGAWTPPRYQTSACPVPGAQIKIGRTMFETDRLPKGWTERCNQMDFVWVPTSFHRSMFIAAGVDPSKVVVIPEPVDTDYFSPEHAAKLDAEAATASASTDSPRSALFVYPHESSSSPRPFRFLSIFKFEERKGWQILLEAFLREFATYPDADGNEPASVAAAPVALYILTSAYHSDADFQKRIDSFVQTLSWDREDGSSPFPTLPPVRLLPSGVSSAELVSLYAGADCFVLPSRGEGWGRPHAESMSMGLPVIATHWSGPSEFMNEANSFPLRHEGLVPVREGAFAGHLWAEPSRDHLRQLMRVVVNDPAAARMKGAQARVDMQTKYCQRCVAQIVIAELARIQGIKSRAETAASAGDAEEERDL